jgi:lactate 2-monooxygenase
VATKLALTGEPSVRDATEAIIALARSAMAVGTGRPYAYAPSYGGAETLTHFLTSFLAELDLCLAICGFKDIASPKDAGCEHVMDLQK